MVQWWKTGSAIEASLRVAKEGHSEMYLGKTRLTGEKYPFPGFPRGSLLYGKLSPLKHQIKNQIFNEAWKRLEDGENEKDIVRDIKGKILDNILLLGRECKLEMLPFEKLSPAVKELHRAWTVTVKGHPQEKKLNDLRDVLCFILQEDDGYRFRAQWLAMFFRPRWWRDSIQSFDFALSMLEHAEVIDDMKERQRLLRRILITVLKETKPLFEKFIKELDWKKFTLSKADKYYFRGKYFKVDYDKYDY